MAPQARVQGRTRRAARRRAARGTAAAGRRRPGASLLLIPAL